MRLEYKSHSRSRVISREGCESLQIVLVFDLSGPPAAGHATLLEIKRLASAICSTDIW